ncbi:MAG: hypothetical protein IKX96_04965 [Firmicutes bacterium]|nr:hypothetical protein [Bacillota bacterium]
MLKRSTPVQFVIRILIYCVALLCLAMGVAFSANSDLGISPVNSLPYVISDILHTAPGTMVTIVFCCYILVQIIILRKEFKWINLFQIAFSTLFGYFVNFTKWLLGDFVLPGGYAGRFIMMLISLVIVAFGVFLYLEVELIPMPMEGMTLAIAQKVKKPFPTVKIWVDCFTVALGIVLTIVFLHKIPFIDAGVRIREGTIIAAIFTGKIMGIIKKALSPAVRKICFKEEFR